MALQCCVICQQIAGGTSTVVVSQLATNCRHSTRHYHGRAATTMTGEKDSRTPLDQSGCILTGSKSLAIQNHLVLIDVRTSKDVGNVLIGQTTNRRVEHVKHGTS